MAQRHRVVGMLALLSVITYLDRVCIAVAGPRMQDDLHIGPEMWGWVTSVFFLSYSAFEIPTGALGDRIEVDVVGQRHALGVDREDTPPPCGVGDADIDQLVETSGAEQRRVD